MSDNTKIEWTTHSFNPWWGCARVSPGCRFCYADRDASRYGHQLWRRHGERRMLSEANWLRPLKWDREAKASGVPAKVFCASMADVFEDHPDVAEPRGRLWRLIEDTPHLRWQILTKRPENIAGMVPWGETWPDTVWLGVSVENQRYADQRIPLLLGTPAAVKFLSCEPLIGPVDLTPWTRRHCAACDGIGEFYVTPSTSHDCHCNGGYERPGIDWVIAGGESGAKARPPHPEWFRDLRDESRSAGISFLFKQWGEWSPTLTPEWPLGDAWKNPQRHRWVDPVTGRVKPFGAFTGIGDETWAHMSRTGRKVAGRALDGRTWDQFPADPAPECRTCGDTGFVIGQGDGFGVIEVECPEPAHQLEDVTA